MRFIAPNIREDAPLKADEIQLDEGCPTAAPRRIQKSLVNRKLRDVVAEEQKFAEERAAREAELAAARAAAIEIQNQFDSLRAAVSTLVLNCDQAAFEIETCSTRMAILEQHVSSHWHSTPLADAIEEFQRHEFMKPRLERYLSAWRAELPTAEKRLAEFREKHGIGQ